MSCRRKTIILAGFANASILRSAPTPRAKSDHALRPCFLIGMGVSRAAATPVLTQRVHGQSQYGQQGRQLARIGDVSVLQIEAFGFQMANRVSIVHLWRLPASARCGLEEQGRAPEVRPSANASRRVAREASGRRRFCPSRHPAFDNHFPPLVQTPARCRRSSMFRSPRGPHAGSREAAG